ncbi:MAG: phosphate ABC transporter substrate-binding protein [Firmicutes bacterium]|nr:phosphate ABC transporter substrate-binding protein [Bacillota bacterium]
MKRILSILNGKSILNVKLISILAAVIITSTILFAGCDLSSEGSKENTSQKGTLEIIGSTSVQHLAEIMAEKFKDKNPDVVINYQGVGSSKGILAAKDGTGDIGTSSRELKEEEKGWGLKEYVIAKDGIAIAVHPDNPVKELTTEQAIKIFKGEITNWKEVGGSDKKIVVLSREAGSGTRGAFEELLKIEDQVVKEALVFDGNGPMKAAIASNQDAIGYVSFGFIDGSIKTLIIDGVEPSVDNVLAGSYPLSRPFIMLTKGDVQGLAKSFVDFVLSDEGQNIVEEEGYIPVNK